MIKTISLLARRPGMTREAFIEYYEQTHAPLGTTLLEPWATRYVRRYLSPLPSYVSGTVRESPFDVATEVWYPDAAALSGLTNALQEPSVRSMFEADEMRLFDRARSLRFMAEERETQLQPRSTK
jgi:hypothetical protein